MTNKDFSDMRIILFILTECNEPLTVQEVAKLINLSTQRTSVLLHKMVLDGLIYSFSNYQQNYYTNNKEVIEKSYPLTYRLYRKLINFINKRKEI